MATESPVFYRGGSILQRLEAAVRKSLSINVPKDNDNVNLSRQSQSDTPAFKEDIPNEEWLNKQIEYAKRRGNDRFGVPYMGKITGLFSGAVAVPLDAVVNLKGERGEQDNVRKADLDAVTKSMRDTGKLLLGKDGKEYAPIL